ncbi:MAG: hypothetical protein ACK4TA_05955 [Saprospiraceae bacterium]
MLKLLLLGLIIYGVYRYFAMANKQLAAGSEHKQVREKKGPINIQININREKKKEDDYIDYEDIK